MQQAKHAVSSTTASRFDADGLRWVRIDGVALAWKAGELFTGSVAALPCG
jgi:hypothetical protein